MEKNQNERENKSPNSDIEVLKAEFSQIKQNFNLGFIDAKTANNQLKVLNEKVNKLFNSEYNETFPYLLWTSLN